MTVVYAKFAVSTSVKVVLVVLYALPFAVPAFCVITGSANGVQVCVAPGLRKKDAEVAASATRPGQVVGVPDGVAASIGRYRNPSVAAAVGVAIPATADPDTVVKNPVALTTEEMVTGPVETNPDTVTTPSWKFVADTTAAPIPVGHTVTAAGPQVITP